jgi:uncharacterized membrane protein YhiD involved in acid resistance
MAAGAGLYVIAVGGAVLVVVTLDLLDRLEGYARRRWNLAAKEAEGTNEEADGRTEDMP